MKIFLFIFQKADQFMQMPSINLDISEKDNKLKSELFFVLHNSFTVQRLTYFIFE